MTQNTKIVMIRAERLEHHPDNPRKEIGDITELAASIGIDGILQNLTVVPQPKNNDKYYIVIGNRRYEAGCAAGLQEFPCVISDMDYNKQLETMLVENMNRSDLTPFEEAKGFEQLTLAGYSTEEIAEKTGFSKSTVRRRMNLCQYDDELVKTAFEHQATLDDFEKLNKINDKSVRNEVAKSLGTNNFNWEFNKALKRQRFDEREKIVVNAVNGIARMPEPNENSFDMDFILTIPTCCDSDDYSPMLEAIEEAKTLPKDEYVYFRDYNFDINLYKPDEEKQEEVEQPAEPQHQAEFEEIEELVAQMQERHFNFIKNYSDRVKNLPSYAFACLDAIANIYFTSERTNTPCISACDISKFLGREPDELKAYMCKHPAKFYLALTKTLFFGTFSEPYSYLYSNYDDLIHYNGDTQNDYIKGYVDKIKLFVNLLTVYGYEVSEEERQLLDGTHRLYHLDEKETEK